MRHLPFHFVGPGLLLGACVALAGCSASAPPPTAPATVSVPVSHPIRREITDYADYTGRTAAVNTVEVRARVSGYLTRLNYTEGVEVKEGDVLYEIDPRPYQATLQQAEAQVRLYEAQLKYQEAVYQRNVRLARQGSVDVETEQQSLAQRDTTQAQLNAARANVELAQLNLGWTKVRSPIDGLTGRALVTRGNMIVADQTVLTTIVSQDPMYAYFDVDEPTALRVQDLIRRGKFPSAREQEVRVWPQLAATGAGLLAHTSGGPLLTAGALVPEAGALRTPIYLGLTTEKGFPHVGYLNFISNQINPSTATLQLRGSFPNPRPAVGPRVLAPGQFARIRVAVSAPYQALLVTQAAVGTDQDVTFVYVLDEHNKVMRRDVTLGTEHDGLQVISRGLGPNDRVVVDGIQHVHPGMTVEPRPVPMPVPRPEALPPTPPAVLKTPPKQ